MTAVILESLVDWPEHLEIFFFWQGICCLPKYLHLIWWCLIPCHLWCCLNRRCITWPSSILFLILRCNFAVNVKDSQMYRKTEEDNPYINRNVLDDSYFCDICHCFGWSWNYFYNNIILYLYSITFWKYHAF